MVETETKIQRYESYKDSGVEWLGDIPEHWEIRKLKSFLEVFGRIGFRGYTTNDLVDEGSGAITISPSNFGDSNLEWTKNSYLSWDKYYESPEIMVEVGDLLIVKTASIGKIAHVRELPEKATVNPQILVVKNVKEDNRFIFYQFLSIVFQTQLMKEKIGSTIYTISENKILNGFAMLPPLPEQTAIAQFLDDKTTKIDQAIAIKQQQIALLKERKQILIHKLVTGQLVKTGDSWAEPADVKDSVVEWIGEIPKHWEVKKLKYIANIFRGAILRPVDDPRYFDENGKWTYLNISDATACQKYLDYGKLKLSELGSTKSARVYPGNLIVTASATIGKPFINRIPVCVHDGFIPLVDIKCNIEYLYFFIGLPQIYISMGKSNTQKNIYLNEFKDIKAVLPPLSEQKEIANYIETASAKIETAINLKEQEISKLQEYKSSLINSVVTGKIRVC